MIRYNRTIVLEHIKAVLEARQTDLPALREAMGMNRPTWSRKLGGELDWSLEELARMARIVQAPPGWPFIAWEYGEALSRAFNILEDKDDE